MSTGPLPEIMAQIVAWLSQSEQPIPDWSPAEWQRFKQAAFIHGVAPLLHDRLINNQLPTPIREWLAGQYENNHRRVAQIQADLQAILACFAAANLPLIPLKGAVLSAVYYQNMAHRPTADIDLLIRPQDSVHSLQLFAGLGYEVETSNWKHAILSRPGNRTIISYEVEHPDNPRRIDLHLTCRELFSGPLVDITADLWATATKGQLLGETACLPNPDMLWLHLLLHTSNNIWNGVLRLINLIDIVQVSDSLHFDRTGRLPADAIDARFIYPALLFCQRHLPHPNQQRLLERCQAAVPPTFKQWLAGQDLISRSCLHPESRLQYLARLWLLYRGRPKDLLTALKFLPSLIKSG